MSPLPSFQGGDVRTRQLPATSKVTGGGGTNGQSIDDLQHTPASSPLLRALPASSTLSASPLSSLSSTSRGSPLLLLLVFVLAGAAVFALIRSLPTLTPSHHHSAHSTAQRQIAEWSSVHFPRSQSDVLSLTSALSRYREEQWVSLVCLFLLLYVFMQSFAIPGPVFLSLLAGPLFGFYVGLLLVSVGACLGACVCYWLSYFLAKSTVERFFPGLLSSFRRRVEANRANLVYQLIFLRISPLLPNWFINVSSAHVNVPFLTFTVATAIGLLPANYIHVSTGMQLHALGATGTDATSTWTATLGRVGGLFLLAFVALIPTLWTKRAEAATEQTQAGAADKRE